MAILGLFVCVVACDTKQAVVGYNGHKVARGDLYLPLHMFSPFLFSPFFLLIDLLFQLGI